jgi:hypothetical protein
MTDQLMRFVVGGLIVSAFAIVGDVLKPKSFAGLFSAAPSVALATLGMSISKYGGGYGSVEGRSMIVGALALFAYSQLSAWLCMRRKWHALVTAAIALFGWFAVAFGLFRLVAGVGI